MRNETNPQNDGMQGSDPTSKQCIEAVKALIEPGNPKSNWFAVCIIGNCKGETQIAVNAVSTLTVVEVATAAQVAMDQLWEKANSN